MSVGRTATPELTPGLVTALVEGLLAGIPHAAWLALLDSRRIVAANAQAERWFGGVGGSLIGRAADALAASPEDLAWWLGAACGDHAPLHSDTLVGTADGRSCHVSRSIRVVDLPSFDPGARGGPQAHVLVTVEDISAEVQAQAQREELLAELQGTLEATADGILVTDLSGRVRVFNRRFAELFTLPQSLLLKRDDAALHECLQSRLSEPGSDGPRLFARAGSGANSAQGAERFLLANGSVLERVARPLLQGGRGSGCVWSFRDLTERLAAEHRIETLSHTDALTGLANRGRLADDVRARLESAEDAGAVPSLSLLVIDLDRFGHINDTLGHEVGNGVLLDVSRRIQGCLRKEDLLARVGGDQFAIVVSPADATTVEKLAARVLNEIKKPCSVGDAQFTLTCSIGVALAPSHGREADELMRRAEQAMRAVKGAGRANWRLHQARAETDWRSHMQLDHAMRQALVSGRFRLNYQPQVCLETGRVTGAEALLRWRDPELGEISPGRFIKVAEDSGFIVQIGDWVLRTAVSQAARWHAQGQSLPVAVNVSALQFQQAHFVERVAETIALAGIPPALLELELTESVLLHDEGGEVLQRLQALAKLGLRMSIDDFGTGYSSLAYLKRIPIHKLKIDRRFVSGLPDDESDAGIVRAILQMARALGKQVIAEGVENEAQRQFLREAGCGEFQGFLFSPAIDALSFEPLLPQAPHPGAVPLLEPPPRRAPRIRLVSG